MKITHGVFAVSSMAMLAVASCDAPSSPTKNPLAGASISFEAARIADAAKFDLTTADAAEAAALNRLRRAIHDPAEREEILSIVNSPNRGISYYADPEVAAAIQDLYRLRGLRHAAERLEVSRAQARSRPVNVTLGTSDAVHLGGARARILRPAGSSGYSVIVLPPSATAGDLALAFRALWELRNREGDITDTDRSIDVRGTPFVVDPERQARYGGYLANMRSGPAENRGGVKLSHAVDVRLGHVRRPSRSR